MADRIVHTPDAIRDLLIYDKDTGKFYWRKRPASMFKSTRACNAWNARLSGKEALTTDNNGYKKGGIMGVDYMAHRVAWVLHYGEWPAGDIDHINCIRNDNRIVNLRDATDSENLSNRGAQNNNKSGFKGVHFCNRAKAWVSKIQKDGVNHYIGTFSDPIKAYEAYCAAAEKHHGEFARVA